MFSKINFGSVESSVTEKTVFPMSETCRGKKLVWKNEYPGLDQKYIKNVSLVIFGSFYSFFLANCIKNTKFNAFNKQNVHKFKKNEKKK